jgi:hypothetical protein
MRVSSRSSNSPGLAPGFRFRVSQFYREDRVYNRSMKSTPKSAWIDPAKRPPKPETMNTPGNFGQFTETMRKLLKAKPLKKPASHGA